MGTTRVLWLIVEVQLQTTFEWKVLFNFLQMQINIPPGSRLERRLGW